MKHYNVLTPDITSYYQDEPPETWRDYVSVEAPNKKQAKVEAVRKFRKRKSEWIKYSQDNPFTGLEVSIATCAHGVCWCDMCSESLEWRECPECMKEWEKEDNESRLSQ